MVVKKVEGEGMGSEDRKVKNAILDSGVDVQRTNL